MHACQSMDSSHLTVAIRLWALASRLHAYMCVTGTDVNAQKLLSSQVYALLYIPTNWGGGVRSNPQTPLPTPLLCHTKRACCTC